MCLTVATGNQFGGILNSYLVTLTERNRQPRTLKVSQVALIPSYHLLLTFHFGGLPSKLIVRVDLPWGQHCNPANISCCPQRRVNLECDRAPKIATLIVLQKNLVMYSCSLILLYLPMLFSHHQWYVFMDAKGSRDFPEKTYKIINLSSLCVSYIFLNSQAAECISLGESIQVNKKTPLCLCMYSQSMLP